MSIFASPVLGHDGLPLDQIRLRGLAATGHHGVLDSEKATGQTFVTDVVLHTDTRPAAAGDDLTATINYADVAADCHAVLEGAPADLIETVAERLAAAVLAYDGVEAVDVRLHKPQAPIPVPFDDVDVAIRRDKAVRPPVIPAVPALADAAPVPEAESEVVATPAWAPVALGAALPAATAVEAEEPALDVTTVGLPPVPAPPVAPPVAPLVAPPAEAEPAGVVVLDAAGPHPRLDADPAEPVHVVLALGANLGDAQATLRQAILDLESVPGIEVDTTSPLARTAAVGGPQESPDYLNAVVLARTTLSARALLHAAQRIEAQHGRVRTEHWGPRTLDIDVITYGDLVAGDDTLEIPHPRAHERAFVLAPWAQVAPEAVLPGLGGGPVGLLADTAPDREGLRWMALDWLAHPLTGAIPVVAVSAAEPAAPAPEVAAGVPSAVPEPLPAASVPAPTDPGAVVELPEQA